MAPPSSPSAPTRTKCRAIYRNLNPASGHLRDTQVPHSFATQVWAGCDEGGGHGVFRTPGAEVGGDDTRKVTIAEWGEVGPQCWAG